MNGGAGRKSYLVEEPFWPRSWADKIAIGVAFAGSDPIAEWFGGN